MLIDATKPSGETSGEKTGMADSGKEPSNADIMKCLIDINKELGQIDNRTNRQSQTLESLQQKVGSFESDLKKMWTLIYDNEKKSNERFNKIEDSVESADFNLVKTVEKVTTLEKKEDEMKNEMLYLQSQSMRNNLIFTSIQESTGSAVENCEKLVRDFMVEKMRLAKIRLKVLSLIESTEWARKKKVLTET